MNVEEAVVLAILLNKGSILNKNPDYIAEKAEVVQLDWRQPQRLLDSEGLKIFKEWQAIWRKEKVNG